MAAAHRRSVDGRQSHLRKPSRFPTAISATRHPPAPRKAWRSVRNWRPPACLPTMPSCGSASWSTTAVRRATSALGFAIGTSTIGFSGMGANEQGIGVTLASGTGIRASTFNSGRSSSATGCHPSATTTALIVGKIKWGANAGAEDTVSIYRPGTNLLLPAAAVATKTAILNQAQFDTLTTYFKAS